MRALRSIFKALLYHYYKDKQKSYVGVSYFLRLYTYAQIIDMLLFDKPINRDEIRQHNKMFSEYWQLEMKSDEEAKKKIANMHIYCGEKMSYVYDVIQRLEEYMKINNFDYMLRVPGKWRPLLVAVQSVK